MSDRWPGDARRRDTLIRLPIGELSEWHLMVACAACHADRILTVRTLLERFGPEQKLVTLVPKLRCKETACRRPPSQVRLRSKFPIHPGPEMVEVLLKAPDPGRGPGR